MLNKDFYEDYPFLNESTVQLFNDSSKWWGVMMPFNQASLNKAMDLNQKGKGVFFSANSMIAWKRSKADTTRINVRICECDTLTKDEQMDLIFSSPIHPSCIVESKNSYHMYRFAKDWDKESYETILRWLAEYFQWDPKICTDRARVLRLPWYRHMKDPNDPFLVECIAIDKEAKYTKEEMMKAFPRTKKEEEIYVQENKLLTPTWSLPSHKPRTNTHDDRWWKVGDSSLVRFSKMWNAQEMLTQISWTSMVNWDNYTFKENSSWTQQIHVNWKPSACWIDKQWMIWSADKWWPTWVDWVRRYWDKSSDAIEDRLYVNMKSRFNEDQLWWYEHKRGIKKDPIQKKKEREEKIEKKMEETNDIWVEKDVELDYNRKLSISRGLPTLDKILKKLTLQDFLVLVAYPGYWKTLISLFMAEKNWHRWIESVFFSLELSKEVLFERTVVEHAWVDWNDYLDAKYSSEKKEIMQQRLKELNNIKNVEIVSSTEPLDIDMLLAWIRKYHKLGKKMFIIDNLGKIHWKGRQNENQRFEDITSQLQDIMKELDIFILLLHHLGKPLWWSENKPGGWSAFRGSQKIKDNCTCMTEIWYNKDPDVWPEVTSTVHIIQYKRTRAWWADRVWLCKFHRWTYITDTEWYALQPNRMNSMKEVDQDDRF